MASVGVENVEVLELELVALSLNTFELLCVVLLFKDSDEILFAVFFGEVESCFNFFDVQALTFVL